MNVFFITRILIDTTNDTNPPFVLVSFKVLSCQITKLHKKYADTIQSICRIDTQTITHYQTICQFFCSVTISHFQANQSSFSYILFSQSHSRTDQVNLIEYLCKIYSVHIPRYDSMISQF